MILADLNITTALASSILAFFLGMLIGIALGYIIWSDREDRKSTRKRLDSIESSQKGQDATNLVDRDSTRNRLDKLEKERGPDES